MTVTVHGPSMGLGAGVTAVTTIAVFLLVQGVGGEGSEPVGGAGWDGASEPELIMMPPADRVAAEAAADAAAAGGTQQTPPLPPPERTDITLLTFTGNGSSALGAASAPLTLVEFGDYQCHFCSVFFNETMPTILENYVETGKVKIIFKDYHLIGPDSIEASHAAHCAGGQGMFWEYHDALYGSWAGENTGWASYGNLASLAAGMEGIDLDKWTECMGDRPHSMKILASNADGKLLGVSGTPSFFIVGQDGHVTPVVGAQPYAFFAAIFDARLAVAGDS